MARGHDQKEKILDAAFEVFGKNGYYDTKMLDIAGLAGVSKGTLYLYFPSKESLYIEVHDRSFNHYLSQLEQKVNGFSTFKEKLVCIAEENLMVFYKDRDKPNKYLQAYTNDPNMIKSLHTFFDNYHKYVTSLMQEEGIRDPAVHAKAFIGMLNNYQRDIFFDPAFDYSALLGAAVFVVDLFVGGCRRNE
ncbi:TetR/AcrR family transcriptional regulator [Peribacillus sp. SCS-37]|uniref:TetR/AcrR family transcriptional regulator n=1 Tax=Paraperibacillus esterisolvens TaxID=3115296 RepID=UPI003905FB9C